LQRAAAELVGNKGQLAAQKAQAEATIAETQNRILATRQAWMEKTVADLRDTQMQVADFTERLRAAQDVAQRTEIRASASGTIVKLHYNTIGGVIQPGQPIADILPTAALEIEGRISTQDINRVSVGRAANLRFPALRSRVTPVVPGELKYVSADRIADPRTGESYYTVRIRLADRLDGDEKAAAGKLQPGMPAEVFVQTGERTFFQYLFAPVSDIMAHSLREQ
jgi:HlyD family type I secretion membrane fusion protein